MRATRSDFLAPANDLQTGCVSLKYVENDLQKRFDKGKQ